MDYLTLDEDNIDQDVFFITNRHYMGNEKSNVRIDYERKTITFHMKTDELKDGCTPDDLINVAQEMINQTT